MTFALLSAAAATAPTRLDPVELFLQADIIVQAVMVGLLLASVWVWTIIVSFSMRIGALGKKSRAYEAEFWEQRDREALLTKQVRKDIPSARIAGAGLDERIRFVGGTGEDQLATSGLAPTVDVGARRITGAIIANLMFGLDAVNLSTDVRSGGGIWLGEIVATFGLLMIVFGVATSGRHVMAPFAVAGYITAAYFATSSTSFANPAVTIARTLSDSFAGIAPESAPGFVIAQIVGGAVGA